MSGIVTDRPLEWANTLRPNRIVATAIFGLRPLRYLSEGASPASSVIEGLRVVAVGCAERPVFHATTGLYGFLKLPPGPRRIEINDPANRYLPWAITAILPDRSIICRALEQGLPPPATPKPLLADVALRPLPDAPLPPGLTAIWGIVRETTGQPVPLTRIACDTVGGGKIVTYSLADGAFVLVLPGEKPASLATPPVFDFPRALTVHSPKPALAASLRGLGFLASMPADLDSLDPNAAGSPFQLRQYRLTDAAGTVTPGPNPNLPVRAAQRSRWNIELLP